MKSDLVHSDIICQDLGIYGKMMIHGIRDRGLFKIRAALGYPENIWKTYAMNVVTATNNRDLEILRMILKVSRS